MLETGKDLVYADFHACVDFDLTDQLGKVQVLALLVASDKDRMVWLE